MIRESGACLVTGASGFVGRILCEKLAYQGYHVRAGVRGFESTAPLPQIYETVQIGNLSECDDWRPAIAGVDTVVHAAGRAHIMRDRADDPLVEYRNINTRATLNLARQAADVGVRRFVFLSSIKVNGEWTSSQRPFTADDTPAPCGPYAISKHEAEVELRRLASQSALEVVIIRLPLVYGPNVKGNLLRLLSLIHRGLPLPFANVDNLRSLVNVRNLVDFVIRCMEHPRAAGETFLVSDGEDVSSRRLVTELASAMGRSPRLFSAPKAITRATLEMSGRGDLWQRLFGSLQISGDKARDLLGWNPPVVVGEGLREMAHWYVGSRCLEDQKR